VTFHVHRLGIAHGEPYTGRRAIVEMLARTGVRVSELCDLRITDVRLHDPEGARVRIEDAKTEAGIREVQLTPDLVGVLQAHLLRAAAAGYPTGPDGYLFPNQRGGRLTRQRAAAILREAAELATERMEAKGVPALPTTTPHTMRRT
jgi:integrase/recombinase XerD